MRKRSHSGMKKLAILGITVLVLTLYLVYAYNNHTGRSYIFEPVYISLTGIIPENTSLSLNYQTFNDPTISEEAELLAGELRAGDDAEEAAFFEPSTMPELAFRSTKEAINQWRAAENVATKSHIDKE